METNTVQFDNELKALSESVYSGNENSIPKGWLKLSEADEKKSGFHAETFYRDGNIVIAIRGTDEIWNDFVKEDVLRLGLKRIPSQYVDAQKFYNKVEKDFHDIPNKKIIFTGHSLGGSLAQLMANKTGCEAVTFNAFGTGDILNGNVRDNLDNIKNYGNISDWTFTTNIDNQLGKTYIIGARTKTASYLTSSYTGEKNNTYLSKYHFTENMGNLEDAKEYISGRLQGYVNYNIDFKDIDNDRIFTSEEIGEMSREEFARLENFIYQQLSSGKVMSTARAKALYNAGLLIWVNAYTRSDGTKVRGYYRSLPKN